MRLDQMALALATSSRAFTTQIPTTQTADSTKPNIVFILSDDQDLHMDSLSYMPLLKKHITDQGVSFNRHYCTVALCCPSRVSLWTGKAAHNTNVTDINPPYGGYPKFVSQGFNEDYLPLWLQDAGYDTYYIGKLFNAQSVRNYNSPHAAGWTGSEFLLDPFTYEYHNATFQRNHDPPVQHENQYSTDVLAEKSYAFLDDALSSKKPFFLTIAPTAPHSNVHINFDVIDGILTQSSVVQSSPVPAERHRHLFDGVKVPRTPHFNPDEANGVSWISRLPKQNATNVDANDDFYRNRLRCLQVVDEIVEGVISRLEAANALDNTYIFYSTDNGYHIGQHRLQPGKQCAFEEDVNIPFMVRGPGIGKGVSSDLVTSHTDLASTFLELAGAKPRNDLDGSAIPLTTLDFAKATEHPQEHVNIEMWGIIKSEGKYGQVLYPNHTYKALRVVGESYNLLYTVWCSNEHELYDLSSDPYQQTNLFPLNHSNTTITIRAPVTQHTSPLTTPCDPTSQHFSNISAPRTSSTLAHLIPRLDSLLMVLKTCKAQTCIHPWETLHPAGDVRSLYDALDHRFDDFYEVRQERIRFVKCEKGYITESEGPSAVQAWMVDEVGVEVD